MKKLFTIALALVLVLCLCACNKAAEELPAIINKEFHFAEGTSVMGVNLSGMNKEAGWNALNSAVSGYVLDLNIDGVSVTATAEDLGLSCSRARYDAIADALEAGAVEIKTEGLIGFNEGKLRLLVSKNFNKPVTEAAIVYDEASAQYVLIPDDIGQVSNPNELVSKLRDSILTLQSSAALTDVSQLIKPTIRDEDAEVTAALEAVNKMRGVQLTYSFTAEGKTSTLTIPEEIIRSLITLGPDNVTPGINQYELESYVAELSKTYSAGSTDGAFITTGGGTVNLTVSYNGVYLDQEAMAADLAACILEGVSGNRTAPFQESGIRDLPYGGTYIEVNLDAQHLWFYKYGECLLSTSFVSGNVATGHITPNGVFSIYYKSPDTYLEGADYRTFVNFWMPFYGGYGLHDATWRGVFGGENYLYNGSHGCVNLPYSSAATLFNYAPVGTPVIVYGGRTSVPPQPQSLGGTTYYSVADDAGTITLDISPRYSGPTMSYSSSNTSVATVSGGVVTIKGVGTAVITVSVPSYNGYTSATTSVTIEVHSACDDGRHKLGTPTVVTPATCQPGIQKVTCSKCSYSGEEAIPAVKSHSYGNWTQTVAPTCGDKGTEERVCTLCNLDKQTRDVNPTGNHTPGSPVTTKEPNCTQKGTTETTCTVCGTVTATGTLDINPSVHVPGALDEKLPTCTEGGHRKQNCSLCGTPLLDETLGATGHNMQWVTITYPTCTTDGSRQEQCQNGCGTTGATEAIGATGHSYSGGYCSCGAQDPNYTPSISEATGTGG